MTKCMLPVKDSSGRQLAQGYMWTHREQERPAGSSLIPDGTAAQVHDGYSG